MTKQRSFYLKDEDWKKLLHVIKDQGFEGKGKLERFMEKLCRIPFLFLQGSSKFKVTRLD